MSTRLNWKPIQAEAIKAAAELGREVASFTPRRSHQSVKTAQCETCYGCCCVAMTGDGFKGGGRILKYRCGTPEARGVK